MIKRAFIDVKDRQVHYRHISSKTHGDATPLVLLHASPGSSKQLEPLIQALSSSNRQVIAPDTPGFGDSTPLGRGEPSITDFATAALAVLDAMGLQRVDLYGSHTGASIAAELAIMAPDRVRRIVLDGVGIFTAEERDEMLVHYAQPFTPDLDGAYLMRAFMFCRDQYLFFPWYKRDIPHKRMNGLPSAEALHAWVLEVLKAPTTYPLGYKAAFRYPKGERLPLVEQPVLAVAAEDDPLKDVTAAIVPKMQQAKYTALPRYDSGYMAALVAAINAFLH